MLPQIPVLSHPRSFGTVKYRFAEETKSID